MLFELVVFGMVIILYVFSCFVYIFSAADRAKSIKTKAVVNESPTDKLIRELREENARLLEKLKLAGGDPAALAAIAAEHGGDLPEQSGNKVDEAGMYGTSLDTYYLSFVS